MSSTASIPIPPPEMRELVGPTDPLEFDNPSGGLVYPYIEPELYESVFDFGCGCGRVARQLILQDPQPHRYVGIDLHRGMIAWCHANLTPVAPHFTFIHHDVLNVSFNPGDKPLTAPFPTEDDSATLVNAHSVFTHLTQQQAQFYLHEAARIVQPHGVVRTTWFLFDKTEFPMLQEEMNALYVAFQDPSTAVIFDRDWVRTTAAQAGLHIVAVTPPEIRGFQWIVVMAPPARGLAEVEFPADSAPVGLARPPRGPLDPARVGLD